MFVVRLKEYSQGESTSNNTTVVLVRLFPLQSHTEELFSFSSMISFSPDESVKNGRNSNIRLGFFFFDNGLVYLISHLRERERGREREENTKSVNGILYLTIK